MDGASGPDVSRGGVQRDLLPLVEGCTVNTRHGPVRTDHILFIAAGAFERARPEDLIPELQGRFPLRVTLSPLDADDFARILTEPEHALTKQYRELLATDGVDLRFTEDGIEEVASLAQRLNTDGSDIGARRLHMVLERLLEPVSFAAPEEEVANVLLGPVVGQSPVPNSILDKCVSTHDIVPFLSFTTPNSRHLGAARTRQHGRRVLIAGPSVEAGARGHKLGTNHTEKPFKIHDIIPNLTCVPENVLYSTAFK